METPHDICRALRSYRINARINQQMIARILGVAQSQVSRWESGRDWPRPHNIEAIRALIWGQSSLPIRSLSHFVTTADLPIALFDHDHRTLALGRPYQKPESDFARFSWAFDPRHNPAMGPVISRYRALLSKPRELTALLITAPFDYEGTPWLATARKTIYPVNGLGLCLAEIRFMPQNSDVLITVSDPQSDGAPSGPPQQATPRLLEIEPAELAPAAWALIHLSTPT